MCVFKLVKCMLDCVTTFMLCFFFFFYFIIYVQIEYFSVFSSSKAINAALGDGFYYDLVSLSCLS